MLPKLSRPHWAPIILNTIGISALAYVNFYLFLTREGLRMDAQLEVSPDFRQGISVAFTSVALCLLALFVIRVKLDKKPLKHLHSVWLDTGLFFFALLNILYNPWVADLFATAPIGWADWMSVAATTVLFITVHVLVRHERKHSRAAVLRLHREKKQSHPDLTLHRK